MLQSRVAEEKNCFNSNSTRDGAARSGRAVDIAAVPAPALPVGPVRSPHAPLRTGGVTAPSPTPVSCICTRARVHPEWRGNPMLVDLGLTAAKRMRDIGQRWMFLDTATSRKAGEEERFLSLYRSMGSAIRQQDAARDRAWRGDDVRSRRSDGRSTEPGATVSQGNAGENDGSGCIVRLRLGCMWGWTDYRSRSAPCSRSVTPDASQKGRPPEGTRGLIPKQIQIVMFPMK